MAKLYFYYSTMNAGKSTMLLQASYNYRERGMNPLILAPVIDNRDGEKNVSSRIGLKAPAISFYTTDQLFTLVESEHNRETIDCVLVDEAQFLECQQVVQLSDVADRLDIPVLCYGLRTDFQGKLFSGSEQLLAWADELTELKTICHCGRKANMVLRIDSEGRVIKEGAQIKIGGNDQYVTVCRKHFKSGMISRRSDELLFDGFDEDDAMG
ncbi:MAG: thymidine kinase [Planctomycetota bacterium]|nr:thymidine kinase [Planctomycetota bacterium]MEC7680492.1 thymidine kinase [Planctomycetota bacterium]